MKLDLSSEDKKIKRYAKEAQQAFFWYIFLLTDNNIGDAGATPLSESLKSNTTLTKLVLWSEDKRKKTHQRHPSTIHSSHFTFKQGTRLETQEQHH